MALRFLPWVKRLFAGAPANEPAPAAGGALALVLVVLMAAGAYGAVHWWQSISIAPSGIAGVDAAATKYELMALAQILEKAQSTGDEGSAVALFDRVMPVLLKLNDIPGLSRTPMHYCHLAAVHLAQGADDVSQGKPWSVRREFNAALDACG